MQEKFKSTLLIILILSSLALTYWLWFGRPPLEEGTAPRYEYAYFTPPPSPSEIVQPAEIVFYKGEECHLFRRGEGEHRRLWVKGRQLLAKKMDPEKMKLCSPEDLEAAWEAAVCGLVYSFEPPFPLEFIGDQLLTNGIKARRITLLWGMEGDMVFVEGEDLYSLILLEETGIPEELLPERNKPSFQLPAVLTFNLTAGTAAGNDPGSPDSAVGEKGEPGEIPLVPPVQTESAGPGIVENWEVRIPGEIFMEEEALFAGELLLEEEGLQRDELVKAFFLDLAMARCIEEKDGAFYFTNGEKGLRLYASGLVEFTAPRLESYLRQRQQLPYALALQKGAENQSLYGGYLPGTYLCAARADRNGYRLIWRRITDGLVWEGENAGCEIYLDEQGVSFYRRNFPVAGEETMVRQPYRPYQEALLQALSLQREKLPGKTATLLELKPVYYLSAEISRQAVPAWAVNFAETGVVYLHWSTLNPLS